MKKVRVPLAIVLSVALSFIVGVAMPTHSTRSQAVYAGAGASDKYDGDCTGTETAGRCADKCPADTAEGAYFVRGYDKDTGAVVCGFSYFNACPYTEAVSADDPMCYKGQPAPTTPVTSTPAPTVNQCGGK